ncbi:MAG: hypothetical protein C0596_06535 [Marinilabiliales bacterium]|nr:MAG: hypothetical protein C0596_06535 [Marinilabiliales bacterium]
MLYYFGSEYKYIKILTSILICCMLVGLFAKISFNKYKRNVTLLNVKYLFIYFNSKTSIFDVIYSIACVAFVLFSLFLIYG